MRGFNHLDALLKADAYAETQAAQNNGGVCKHCNASFGHFGFCPLINGVAVATTETGQFTEDDRITARSWGIIL
jgi:hypothetical protein